jgi:type 2 lantibiotic biosynthesis protein LanM
MDNQTTYSIKNEFATIPFVDIILPYTVNFLNEIQKKNISLELVNKLHVTLLHELSIAAEVTLQEELNYFKNNGQDVYQEFVETTNSLLVIKYPFLDIILKRIANSYLKHLKNIFSNFSKDFSVIATIFSIKENEKIIDIDTSLGDGHSGESTALVTLSDSTKLIYKPRNIETANSYNLFIDWVNDKLNTNLKTLKCVCFENYGWLEFVTHDAVNSPEDLQEYYYKAGILLSVTLLLGSKDYHYENIIAAGKNPVIIDHETIIQPILSNQSIRTWDEQHKISPFSVLESMLIVNHGTGVPLEFAGYGIEGNVEALDMVKKVINPNTIDSKRDTRFVFRKLIKENIPIFNDTHVFVTNYKNSFVEGFSNTYDMFIDSREELMSSNSPIRFFENQNIRYVWRPTFVYFKILKYMRSASFMSSFEAYKSKLFELMSKAYKNENFKFILECEMNQMLNGDVPFFNLNSLNCHLEEDKSFKIFTNNCIENIRLRISLFSTYHKEEQLKYITSWLNI